MRSFMKTSLRIEQLSGRLYDRAISPHARVILIASLVLILGSLVLLPFLRMDANLDPNLPQGPEWTAMQEVGARMDSTRSIMVVVSGTQAYDAAAFERLRQISASLEGYPEQWELRSAANAHDVRLEGDELRSVDIGSSPAVAEGAMRSRALLRTLFLSRDLRSWTLWLTLKPGNDPAVWFPVLDSLRKDHPGLLFGGVPYLKSYYERILPFNVFGLLLIALVVVLLVYLCLLRSWRAALILWLASAMPTVLLCAIFVVTGTAMRIYTILAPFLTLALATSYNLQLFYGWLLFGRDARVAFVSRAPVLVVDAATGMLGFATLFLSPFGELRALGVFTLVGIGLALLFVLLAGTSLLCVIAGRPMIGLRFLENRQGSRERKAEARARGKFAVPILGLLLFLGALGMTRLGVGLDWTDHLLPWSQERADLARIESLYGSFDQLVVEIDTGQEYGLAEMDAFRRIDRIGTMIAGLDGVSATLSYTTAVREMLGRLDGKDSGVDPRSGPEIAESVEMLAGTPVGRLTDSLYDPQLRKAFVLIRLNDAGHRPSVLALREAILKVLEREPSWKYRLGGSVLVYAVLDSSFVSDQGLALGLLILGYLIFLSFVFGTIRKAFVALAPSIMALVIVLGGSGFLGWRLNGINAVALVAIIGISIDSAIMCLMVPSNSATRRAIRDTMLVLGSVMLVLAGSSFYTLFETAIMAAAGLLVAMYIVLQVVDQRRHDKQIQ